MNSTAACIGKTKLKNPVICAAGEHVMSRAGIQKALQAGAAAVVAKSTNETSAARSQMTKADYLALDADWRPVATDNNVRRDTTFICRSGLTMQSFEEWLSMVVEMDQVAASHDAYVIASLVVSDLDAALEMGVKVEQAGVRILELNIGTPYEDEAEQSSVLTVQSPDKVREIVQAVRNAVALPVWVKLTGQSERVDSLVLAAKAAGADSVVFPGRFLGMIPDIESQQPFLGSNVGVGGGWNLPLSCYWIARTYRALGAESASGEDTFPLIGTNGARSGLDVIRFLLAGATAVEMASAVLTRGYDAIADAVKEVEDYLEDRSTEVMELVGKASDVKAFEKFPSREIPWCDLPIE